MAKGRRPEAHSDCVADLLRLFECVPNPLEKSGMVVPGSASLLALASRFLTLS